MMQVTITLYGSLYVFEKQVSVHNKFWLCVPSIALISIVAV